VYRLSEACYHSGIPFLISLPVIRGVINKIIEYAPVLANQFSTGHTYSKLAELLNTLLRYLLIKILKVMLRGIHL